MFMLTLLGAAPAMTQATSAPAAQADRAGSAQQAKPSPTPITPIYAYHYICRYVVPLYSAPGGDTLGYLYYGDIFYEDGRSGDWSYGYSYSLYRAGWVPTSSFCP
jgi:hypothetical protein